MQLVKNKESLANKIFLTGLLMELVVMIAGHSSFIDIPFAGRMTHVAFGLFVIKILMTDYSKMQWLLIFLCGGLGSVSYMTCGDEYVIRGVVFIFATKGIEVKRVLQLIFYATLIGFIVIVGTSILGVAGDVKQIANFGRGEVETRYVLGFSHANNLHDTVWYLLAILLLFTYKHWNWKHYLMATVVNVGTFMLSASRNGLLSVQILLVACFLIHYFPSLQKSTFPYVLGGIGYLVCLWMTWLGGKYGAVNSELTAFFDRFLNARLEMVWEFAPLSALELFPPSRQLSFVDNGFASFFHIYGIVVGIVFLIFLMIQMIGLYKRKDAVTLSVLVTAIFITFIESTYVFNTSLLCNMTFITVMMLFNEEK